MTATDQTPERFVWNRGIPARDRFAYARQGDVPLKLTHLTMLRLLRIEELDDQRMPLRTMASIDLGPIPGDVTEYEGDQARAEQVARDLGIVPA